MHGVNFIPIHFRQDRRRRRLHVLLTSLWATGLCAVGVGWAYTHTLVPNPDLVALDRELDEIDARLNERANEIERLNVRITAAQELRAQQVPVVDQPDWSILLALIAQSSGDAVVLSDVHLDSVDDETGTSFSVDMAGWGRTQKAVSDFLMRMESSGAFSNIIMTESRRRAFHNSEAANFAIAGVIHDEERH